MIAAAAATALLAGCGGGGGSATKPAVVPQPPGNTGQPAPSSTSFKYLSNALRGAPSAGPVQIGTMKVDVQMKLRNPTGLQAYAAAVGDPKNGLYRHFLTPDEIASRFGATDADYNTAINYFKSEGLEVTGWKQKSLLRVVGPQANMEHAFGTTFALYHASSGDTFGPASAPHFAKPLAVHSVTQIVFNPKWTKRNSTTTAPHGRPPGFTFGLPAQQIAAAFDYNGAYAAGYTGTGITIGIVGTGPIDQNDYNVYRSQLSSGWYDGSGMFHATMNTITQVNVQPTAAKNGGTPATPPPVTAPNCSGPLPGCNPEDAEAQLDTQQSAALAPTANVLFYLGYVPHENYGTTHDFGPRLGIQEVNDEVQQAINDNAVDILSASYSLGEPYSDYTGLDGVTYDPNGTEPSQFAMLQAEGIAVFVSSGDSGAQGCARPFFGTAPGVSSPDQPCVMAPAVDQNVTAVGGITAPIDESGRKIGPYTTWGVQTQQGFGATGGGVSVAVPKPAYQTGPGITGSMRNVPDAALDADPFTGVTIALSTSFAGGGFFAAGGTSIAPPEMAAMWALVLDACRQTAACAGKGSGPKPYRMGNAAPAFYRIYNDAVLYPATFLDIVDGNNGIRPCTNNPFPTPPAGSGVGPCPNPSPTIDPGFNAGTGYDHTTGIGVPFARHLIKAVVGV